MTDLAQRILQNVPNFTIAPSEQRKRHPYQRVKTLGGASLNLPMRQVPTYNSMRTSNVWRYPVATINSSILQTGGQVNFKIDRGSGSGRVKSVYLRMAVTLGTGDLYTLPTPLWLQQLQWQTPSGATIQQFDGYMQWLMTVLSIDYDRWEYALNYMLSTNTYQSGSPITAGASIYYIPLTGSWLEASDFFIPAVDGDLQLYATFQPPSVWVMEGTVANNLSVSAMSLDIEMENLAQLELQRDLMALKSVRTDYFVPYCRTQRWNSQLTPNNMIEIPLNSIKGDVVFVLMTLRLSSTALSGPGQIAYSPFYQFQIVNSEGVGITAQQPTDSLWNTAVQFPQWFLGRINAYGGPIYSHNFSENSANPLSFLTGGHKMAAYPFTTNERLRIWTPAAGVNESVNIQWAGNALPLITKGTFQFVWNTPDGTSVSAPVQFNDTIATLIAAIEEMDQFDGTISFDKTFSAATQTDTVNTWITATFGGNYSFYPLFENGYSLQIQILEPTETSAGAVYPYANNATRTVGVEGISSGSSYTLDFYAFTSNIVSLFPNGQLEVTSS